MDKPSHWVTFLTQQLGLFKFGLKQPSIFRVYDPLGTVICIMFLKTAVIG